MSALRNPSLSRPQQSLALPAVLAGIAMFVARPTDAATVGDSTVKVPDQVSARAQPFDLREVRLLDGPFKRAMELDRQFLLELDPDRLLHTFRLNAGLPSSAKPLGGWEEPKCELRGHFTGHYLSACALMYASTGDARVKAKGDTVVAGLAECQAKLGSGYLSAYPEEFLDRVEKQQRVWAPYYTLHKILAGLLDMYAYGDNRQALEVARKFADWTIARNARLTDEQMQAMLGNEHGGMNESLANLYALTGEEKYLAIARRFNHHAVLDPAARQQDSLTGLHANTQFPKFIGAAREYELTGDEPLHTAATFFWNTVVRERSYVIGGNSDGEMFTAKEKLSTAFGPSTTETCNTYNMLKLTRHLFAWDPKVEYADFYERALFNHILASQNPEDGMTCYYVPLKSGSHKVYCDAENSFWCCTGTGVENHAKYGDSIYFHEGDQALYVNLFIASELDWTARALKIRQETAFPASDTTRLTFACEKPTELELRLRRPSWATTGFAVSVNGDPLKITGGPGSWFPVKRTWRSGDTVDVRLPFNLRTEGFADNPRRFALLNGPLVLAAAVDQAGPFPAVVTEPSRLLASLEPVAGRPNTFAGPTNVFRAPGGPGGVTLEPFYQMHGGRSYMVYFDSFTPGQWEVWQIEYRAAIEKQKLIDVRTVDLVLPDNPQNERDHNLQGEHTSSGDFGDRKWRHATEGGWFSWDLKVQSGEPQEFQVTYWGSDGGNRVFDVLLGGEKLATEHLQNNRPDQFYEQVYLIPAAKTQGRDKLTIRFQAQAGAWAGGVFGVRVMKPAP